MASSLTTLLLIAAVFLVFCFFYYAAGKNKRTVLLVLLAWLFVQALISLSGFYTVTDQLPPRVIFLVLPPLLTVIALFITKKGRAFIDGLNTITLTYIHTVRIVVEIVLYLLFIERLVPDVMTLRGGNWDILSGLSAPLIAWLCFSRNLFNRQVLLTWNFFALVLLLNVVVHGLLSAPYPFQQFGFEQPNIAMLHFPFIYIPGFIVPLILFAHLVVIRRLWKNTTTVVR